MRNGLKAPLSFSLTAVPTMTAMKITQMVKSQIRTLPDNHLRDNLSYARATPLTREEYTDLHQRDVAEDK